MPLESGTGFIVDGMLEYLILYLFLELNPATFTMQN